MVHLSIDIETVARIGHINDYIENNTKVLYGNTKDQEKKDAKKIVAIDKAKSKAGLRWITGKIISVAIVDIQSDETYCYYGDDESSILLELNNFLNSNDHVKLYGKNISTFDVPYIVGRMMANKIIPSKFLRDKFKVEDIDTYFGYSSASDQRARLNDYCFALGIKGKDGMDGSMVHGLYVDAVVTKIESEHVFWEKLKEYNISDSMIVADIVKLFRGKELG